MNLLKKLFDHEYKEMKKFEKLADERVSLDEEYSKLTDKQLAKKTDEVVLLFTLVILQNFVLVKVKP